MSGAGNIAFAKKLAEFQGIEVCDSPKCIRLTSLHYTDGSDHCRYHPQKDKTKKHGGIQTFSTLGDMLLKRYTQDYMNMKDLTKTLSLMPSNSKFNSSNLFKFPTKAK